MRIVRTWVVALSVILSLGVGPAGAFQVLSHSIVPDSGLEQYRFLVVFDWAPDFTSADVYDRQADTFQFYINRAGWYPFATSFDSEVIVRGEEIHRWGDIALRDRAIVDDGPGTGGWGGIAGHVPFTLTGAAVRFTVPYSLIDSDGYFGYCLHTCEYGSTTGPRFWGTTPEPAGLSLLAVGGLLASRRRRREATHGTHTLRSGADRWGHTRRPVSMRANQGSVR